MAGSLTYRSYTSDDGNQYSIKIDESNASATVVGGAGGALCPVRTANLLALPKGLKKRYVLCFNQLNPLERRKFYVGATAVVSGVIAPGAQISAEDYPGAGDVAGSAQTWTITAYRGEQRSVIPAFNANDTGLTDGTVTQ